MAEPKKDTGLAQLMREFPELDEYRARQLAEYGTFVAVQTITKGGAVAYNRGHPVPVSNVVTYRYDERGMVERTPDADRFRWHEDAVRAEWGTYVANQPIYDGEHLVYRQGDRVPAAHAEGRNYVDRGLVDNVKGK